MGFLDDIKKGLGDVADGINSAVQGATTSSPQTPPPPPPPPASPASWIDADRLTALAAEAGVGSVTFGPPQTFGRDDGVVARYTATDGSVTVDVVEVSEAFLGTLQTMDGVIAHYGAAWAEVTDVDLGDRARSGSTGPGQRSLVVCVADLVAGVDVYAPASVPPERVDAFVTSVARTALDL